MNRIRGFFDEELAAFIPRVTNLIGWRRIRKLWFILVWLLVLGFTYLPFGAKPLIFLDDTGFKWTRMVVHGTFLIWSVWVTVYLQWGDIYTNLVGLDRTTQGIAKYGNKSLMVYLFLSMIFVGFLLLQTYILGEIYGAVTLICAFLHLLPLTMGTALESQARNLGPFVVNMLLCVMSILTIISG